MASRYGAPALDGGDPAHPHVTPGRDPARPGEYDFWDHLDWAVERAAAHGLYLALVPSWGSLASSGKLNPASAEVYGRRSEEHTSELQSLMRISYAVFCLKKNKKTQYRSYNVKK